MSGAQSPTVSCTQAPASPGPPDTGVLVACPGSGCAPVADGGAVDYGCGTVDSGREASSNPRPTAYVSPNSLKSVSPGYPKKKKRVFERARSRMSSLHSVPSTNPLIWRADDEVLEEWWLKNALGRAEQTHKSQTAP